MGSVCKLPRDGGPRQELVVFSLHYNETTLNEIVIRGPAVLELAASFI